jgi:hypothetical protein
MENVPVNKNRSKNRQLSEIGPPALERSKKPRTPCATPRHATPARSIVHPAVSRTRHANSESL